MLGGNESADLFELLKLALQSERGASDVRDG